MRLYSYKKKRWIGGSFEGQCKALDSVVEQWSWQLKTHFQWALSGLLQTLNTLKMLLSYFYFFLWKFFVSIHSSLKNGSFIVLIFSSSSIYSGYLSSAGCIPWKIPLCGLPLHWTNHFLCFLVLWGSICQFLVLIPEWMGSCSENPSLIRSLEGTPYIFC